MYKSISWYFPFSWVYDYRIGEIAGLQFGYFRITGNFFSDRELVYDLLLRLMLLAIFSISVLSVLYPLAKKIPEQLFINPINRFIDLALHNSSKAVEQDTSLPVELEMLETRIFSLLNTATEYERNKAAVELGHLTARLAHDIHSPLAAMEISLFMLDKKIPHKELTILINGIQSLRDIANNILERYRKPGVQDDSLSFLMQGDGNIVKPILLSSLVEKIILQKRREWYQQACGLSVTIKAGAKASWILASSNETNRLLSNLLNNAYDALQIKEEGFIRVTLTELEEGFKLELHDNGIGIPSDKVSDVLNGVSLKHAGKGIGLSESKRYMDSLNGKLTIDSKIGVGTKISLFFPRFDSICKSL